MTVGIKRDKMITIAIDAAAKLRIRAGPLTWTSHRITGIMKAKMANTMRNFFISSQTKVPGVVLLKPYFSSMTKVE